MITLTNEEKTELMKSVLKNAKIQLMEFVMTRDFNKLMLAENPQAQEKIKPLILMVEGDIKQTAEYIEFIKQEIKKTEELSPSEITIIFNNKKNEKN